MPAEDVTPESEARWQAWLAKGRGTDVRSRHRMRISLVLLVSSAAVVAAFVIGLG